MAQILPFLFHLPHDITLIHIPSNQNLLPPLNFIFPDLQKEAAKDPDERPQEPEQTETSEAASTVITPAEKDTAIHTDAAISTESKFLPSCVYPCITSWILLYVPALFLDIPMRQMKVLIIIPEIKTSYPLSMYSKITSEPASPMKTSSPINKQPATDNPAAPTETDEPPSS